MDPRLVPRGPIWLYLYLWNSISMTVMATWGLLLPFTQTLVLGPAWQMCSRDKWLRFGTFYTRVYEKDVEHQSWFSIIKLLTSISCYPGAATKWQWNSVAVQIKSVTYYDLREQSLFDSKQLKAIFETHDYYCCFLHLLGRRRLDDLERREIS